MMISFRPAVPGDFDYCARLYFTEMETIIRELKLDRQAQTANFRRQWNAAEARIIILDGAVIGWLQSAARDGALFLAQLFVEGAFQRQGIGTAVMHRLIAEATQAGQPMALEVVKINPAKRLYDRLGFRTTGEDDRKYHMRREPDRAEPASS
jgi:ribosomal protein S18 acetylase RimI-like enzyme